MKYIFKLAFSSIMREKRRTVLTFLILSFGVVFYIAMSNLMNGLGEQSFKNQINFETGDCKIRSAAYDEDKPFSLSNYIGNYLEAERILKEKKYVRSYTELISFIGELDNSIDSESVIVTGVNPENVSTVFILTNFITQGGFEKDGAVIGKSLASGMGLSLGDFVYITFRNGQGMFDSIEMTVSGIINSPNPQVNNSTVFITMEDAKKYLSIDSVTEIAVKTADYKKFDQYRPDLEKSLAGYKIYSWKKLGEGSLNNVEAHNQAAGMILFLIAVIALVGIINTMLMSVFEKKRMIGTLKAMGMLDGEIRLLFMTEGFIIGALGSIAGIILGALVTLYLAAAGIDYSFMMSNPNIEVPYKILGIVKAKWDIIPFLNAFIVCVLTSTLASFYPANKATRLPAAECLRAKQ